MLQRRTAVSKSSSLKQTASSNGKQPNGNSRRRKKQRPNSIALRAAIFVVSFILATLIIVANHLFGTNAINGASANINKKSDLLKFYLRNKVNANVPDDAIDPAAEERAKQREARYHSLYRPKFDQNQLGYDTYNCPSTPPDHYPMAWTTVEVLSNWMPHDVTTIAPAYREIYQGLCVFDYTTQYDAALNYRKAELPFIIRNDPNVISTARRWEDDTEYLHNALGDETLFRTERSPMNEFMWYRLRGKGMPRGYVKPPNDEINMSYGEWLERALAKDAMALQDEDISAKVSAMKKRRMQLVTDNKKQDDSLENDDHDRDNSTEEEKLKNWYYFRLTTSLRHASKDPSPEKFVYDELPFLDPRKRSESQFYIVDPSEERGINCRFGMRGVISANHFDMSRNFIMIFGGERRYILGHPNQCKNMALHPIGHPSLRHSKVDWNNPLEWDENPEFKQALVNEVVLHAGDALYLPTAYFHYIVNLSLNYQCNARSGTTHENAKHIRECGFNMG
ncbi:cupin domain-containing protein [Skeletonema marinoi]|uniref:Cupin domain-containing protein n=1 Tax=Skeletonema marinoi TaxID=267567 RepID=A0AAD9DA80_9STRA|nr:cupin domain-containing protein [Skeletonema marinoi]